MLQLQNTISVADIIGLLTLIVAATAAVVAVHQIRENHKTQKATFFKEVYTAMYDDPLILEGWHLIEYETFTYDDNHFDGSLSTEKAIDRMLGFYDLICDLFDQRILTEREMMPFRYKLLTTYRSPDIRRYMNFVDAFSLSVGIPIENWHHFRTYCESDQHTLRFIDYMTVDQAYWFYKEQKSKIDKLLVLAEEQLTLDKNNKSDFECKIMALDTLIERFQQFPNITEKDDPVLEAISEGDTYDRIRIIIGLQALKARATMEHNEKLGRTIEGVPEKIYVGHLQSIKQ